MFKLRSLAVATVLCIGAVVPAVAQQPAAPSPPPTTPYGPPIGLDAAKKVMAAAEAEAMKNNWPMAIVVLDSTGHIVMLQKLDNTQYGSIGVAEDKAHSAPIFGGRAKCSKIWWRRAASTCGSSPFTEQRRSRVGFPSLSMARSLVPSGFPAGLLRRTGRSLRPGPTLPRPNRQSGPVTDPARCFARFG